MSKVLQVIWNVIKKYKKTSILLVLLATWWLYGFCYNRSFPKDTGEYIPYVMGKVVDFTAKGDSAMFVKDEDGWGNQEEKYRCTVKKDVFMRYYVKNDGNAVKLMVRASGSFPYPDDHQRVIVSINGTKFTHWDVSAKDWYQVIIPASMIPDNKLEIRFSMTKPYTPKGDTRKLGMIVEKIKLEKIYGQQTRVRLRNWQIRQINKWVGELTEEERAQYTTVGE